MTIKFGTSAWRLPRWTWTPPALNALFAKGEIVWDLVSSLRIDATSRIGSHTSFSVVVMRESGHYHRDGTVSDVQADEVVELLRIIVALSMTLLNSITLLPGVQVDSLGTDRN